VTEKPKNPIQPFVTDVNGTLRFKGNQIVVDLLEKAGQHGLNLNAIACRQYSADDRQQLAQLIGYSLSGYGELSYVSEDAYGAANAMAEEGMSEKDARISHLEGELSAIRSALREPMAQLFGIHPDDLGGDP